LNDDLTLDAGSTFKAFCLPYLRLNDDLTLDAGFAPSGVSGTLRYVHDIEVQADGKILICGGFDGVNGSFRRAIARLEANGTLDAGFVPPTMTVAPEGYPTGPATINGMDLQDDGKIVISGSFNRLGSTVIPEGVGRLFPDGSMDFGFAVGAGTEFLANKCLVLRDGRILFGGLGGTVGGVAAPFLACVNGDGSLDTAFMANLGTGSNGWMGGDLVELPDGKILVAGIYNDFNGVAIASVVRLNPDGTRETGFTPLPHTANRGEYGTHAYGLAPQPDGKIVAVGWMSHPDMVVAGTPAASPGLQVSGTNGYNVLRFEGDPLSGPGQLQLVSSVVHSSEFAGQAVVRVVRVVRVGGSSGAASVQFGFTNGSATEGVDFTGVAGSLSWADGEIGEKTIVIPVAMDGLAEGVEEFAVSLSGATGASVEGSAVATVFIVDGDSGPMVLMDPVDVTVNQGQTATFSVTVSSPVPVSWTLFGKSLIGRKKAQAAHEISRKNGFKNLQKSAATH